MVFNVLNQMVHLINGVLGVALLLVVILLLKNWRSIIREIAIACGRSGLKKSKDKGGETE